MSSRRCSSRTCERTRCQRRVRAVKGRGCLGKREGGASTSVLTSARGGARLAGHPLRARAWNEGGAMGAAETRRERTDRGVL
jgi:hypothetical protein